MLSYIIIFEYPVRIGINDHICFGPFPSHAAAKQFHTDARSWAIPYEGRGEIHRVSAP